MHDYDATVFLSDSYRDIEFARRAGVESIAIIPNGAACEEFNRPKDLELRARLGIPEDHQLILHIAGYLSVAKGQAESIKIFSNSSLSKATLLLVCPDFKNQDINEFSPKKILKGLYHLMRGNGLRGIAFPTQLRLLRRLQRKRNKNKDRQVIGVSLSRKDAISAFLDSDLLLFPSWIECSPLVLFEAAAARTPFLVTDVGNAREIINWTGGGRILPGLKRNDREGSVQVDVEAGARCLNELMADQEVRKQMATNAHQAWLKHFTWSRIAEQYEQLYSSLLEDKEIQELFKAPPSYR